MPKYVKSELELWRSNEFESTFRIEVTEVVSKSLLMYSPATKSWYFVILAVACRGDRGTMNPRAPRNSGPSEKPVEQNRPEINCVPSSSGRLCIQGIYRDLESL